VARSEGLEPTDADIDAEIERLAASYNVKPAQLRRNLERADQIPAVRSDWRKTKALDWLLEHVEIVDEQGNPVDRSLLEPDVAEAEQGEAPAEGEMAGAEESSSEVSRDDEAPRDEETGEQ
jgi:hypothetical protein